MMRCNVLMQDCGLFLCINKTTRLQLCTHTCNLLEGQVWGHMAYLEALKGSGFRNAVQGERGQWVSWDCQSLLTVEPACITGRLSNQCICLHLTPKYLLQSHGASCV